MFKMLTKPPSISIQLTINLWQLGSFCLVAELVRLPRQNCEYGGFGLGSEKVEIHWHKWLC